MRTCNDFLDELLTARALPSDYQLAGFLEVSRASISTYRRKKSFFDDAFSILVADLLNYPATYVLACAHYERAARLHGEQSAPARVWRAMAETIEKKPGGPGIPGRKSVTDKKLRRATSIYYVKSPGPVSCLAITSTYPFWDIDTMSVYAQGVPGGRAWGQRAGDSWRPKLPAGRGAVNSLSTLYAAAVSAAMVGALDFGGVLYGLVI